ncbi:hypothetical protein N8I77_007903 [Diaporthe amygdali]|uniref:SRR1-like domain-containing protein n=1 Tax=Phomopsis amygdali TaxID=1214568 RepID=A0AAD9SE83_PHOAM|nr:hypothetical protein N8I77_007903 [Diaporthe amygdali]
MQSLASQFDDSNSKVKCGDTSKKFFVTPGVDGNDAEIEIATGRVVAQRDGVESIMMDPFLDYIPYQRLISQAQSINTFCPNLAYCPLRVKYHICQRSQGSTQVLPAWTPEPLDAVRKTFAAKVKDWEASEACKQLRDCLETAHIPGPIKKIVAFACSTIASRPVWPASIAQHCLILTLRDFFSKAGSVKAPHNIQCFAQDSTYTQVDRDVLKEKGIRVLDDPRAFLEVDDSTIVLSFSPDVPVRQIITDLARPAALLWDQVHTQAEIALDT